MSKSKKAKVEDSKTDSKTASKKLSASDQLKKQLDANKDAHYNYHKTVDFEVSQGSFILDMEVGKIRPGIIRHTGVSRGGKTSQMLANVYNFLNTVENSRGLWIISEGRLSEDIKKRSGIKFVYSPKEWEDGTCFVLESNVYELVFDLMRDLLRRNDEGKRYFFVIDSSNGLKRKDDLEKATSEADKVAGGALLTSDFLSRVSLGMAKFGHVLGMIGQVRSRIKVNQYEKGDPSLSNASGGAAADHYPSIFLEFQPRYRSDLIGDPNNPSGHWAKVKVIKSDKEKATEVRYPIKYGKTGGNSIWIEYEIAELLLQWGFVVKSGSWLSFTPDVEAEVRDVLKGTDWVEPEEGKSISIQGVDNLRAWLEEYPVVTEHFYNKFKKLLT